MSSTSAAVAGTLVASTLLAGVALDYDRRRRRKKLQDELEELKVEQARQAQRTQASLGGKKEAFLPFMQHYSNMFGKRLSELCQRIVDEQKGQCRFSTLPLLGEVEPPHFVQAAVVLLFGDASLLEHWPWKDNLCFGLTITSIAHSEPIIRKWLTELAQGKGLYPCLGPETEVELLKLCFAEHPSLCKLPSRNKELISCFHKLGFLCGSGGFLKVEEGNRLQFHSNLTGYRLDTAQTPFYAFNFEFPRVWSKSKGSTDAGFDMIGGNFVDCQVKRVSSAQLKQRMEVAAHILLKRSAMEVRRRLDAHLTCGLKGCTLEWCSAISGHISPDLMSTLMFSRKLDLLMLHSGQLRKNILQNLEFVAPASRQEIKNFVDVLIEYLRTQLYATKMLEIKATAATAKLEGRLSHPQDLARQVCQSTFNAAHDGYLSLWDMPVMLRESLRSLQELRESQRFELECAPQWWSALLGCVAMAFASVLLLVVSRMMFAFPVAAAGATGVQSVLWLNTASDRVPLLNSYISGHKAAASACLCLVAGAATWLAVSSWMATLAISSAMTAHLMWTSVWQQLPFHFLQISYCKLAQILGWPMLIFRNLSAMEQQLRAQLKTWRFRIAEQHLKAHVARGHISAREGESFLRALLWTEVAQDGQEQVLPGSLEEAEAFLSLSVQDSTSILDLNEAIQQLSVDIQQEVDDAIWQTGDLMLQGLPVDSDSDSESDDLPVEQAAAMLPELPPPEELPLKLRRRERKLEYVLRQNGWEFERRRKKIVFRRGMSKEKEPRKRDEKENMPVEQIFSMTAKPKDPRHRKREVAKLRRLNDSLRSRY